MLSSHGPQRGSCRARGFVAPRAGAAVLALAAVAALLASCGGSDDDGGRSAAADPVQFQAAELVTEAPVLSGDPGSGRCGDTRQPCFENNPDILGGQRALASVDDMQALFITRRVTGVGVGYENDTVLATLPTRDSKFVDVRTAAVDDPSAGLAPLGLAALGAYFGAPAQRLVTLQLHEDASSAGTELWVRSGNASRGRSGTRSAWNHPLQAVAADLAGKGVESIVYLSDGALGVAVPTVDASGVATDWTLPDPILLGNASSFTVGNVFGTGPQPVALVTDTSLQVRFFDVDRTTQALAPTPGQTVTIGLREGHYVAFGSARVIAGRFTDPTYDQLIVVFDEVDAGGKPLGVTFVLLDRGPDGNFRQGGVQSGVLPGAASYRLRLAKGRFLAGDAYEGVVVMQDFGVAGNGRLVVSLVDYDPTRRPQLKGAANVPSLTCSYGMDTGNFDRQRVDDDGTVKANRNLQVGLLLGLDCSNGISGRFQAAIWEVSPATGSAALPLLLRGTAPDATADEIPRNGSAPIGDPVVQIALAVLDLQGRSMVLGPPQVLSIEHRSQPSVVVAAPPMHVDWEDGELRNYTAAPDGFYSRYTSGSSSEAEGSSTNVSTWSFGAEETVGAKFVEGDCDEGNCVSVKDEFSAGQDLDGSTKAINSRFASRELEVSQQTAFNDVLWYDDSALTLYVYPILGRTTCPASRPSGCSESEKVPVTLTVAGPDTVVATRTDATHVAWYQPPWVAGQVLSYPATLGQLEAAAQVGAGAGFNRLTDTSRWSIDPSETDLTASWRQGSSTADARSLNGNFSFKNTLSATYKAGVPGLATGQVSASLSLGGSFGFKNLTDSRHSVSQTTGLSFTKKAAFDDFQDYGYWLEPYIFAENIPPEAVSADTRLDGLGVLQSGFVVDVLKDGAGPLWARNYRAAPDLALLHPSRLIVKVNNADGGPGCIRYGTTGAAYNCVTESPPMPERPLDDFHHHMRGLFVSEATSAGQGPQMLDATAGDQLVLQARVHNLSLAPMPAGTTVKVRFYATVWDHDANAPARSFAIGTASLPAVQPYQQANDTPNWALASQAFDTTGHDGEDLYFWVVTWMEDAGGNLVREREERGLSGIPAAELDDYATLVELEEAHGNNIGFFNLPFHVRAPNRVAAPRPEQGASKPALRIAEVGSESRSIRQGGEARVAARVTVGQSDLPAGASVVFYDGDPLRGGQVIGVRRQPFLRADTTYDFRVPFRSGTCGEHTVHVVVAPGTRFEHTARLQPIEVACS